MQRDKNLSWEKGFPYDVLSRYGVTPFSSMPAVSDVEFEILAEPSADARQALAEIEQVSNRLFVDFFFYQGPVNPIGAGGEHA